MAKPMKLEDLDDALPADDLDKVSGGDASVPMPVDVCQTPAPSGGVPIPYPVIGGTVSSGTSQTIVIKK